MAAPGGQSSESVWALYPASCRDISIDGGNSPGRDRFVPATPGLRAAGGRLPNYSGDYLLSRRLAGCDGNSRYCAARKAVWTSARSESDDLDQLGRQFNHNSAV